MPVRAIVVVFGLLACTLTAGAVEPEWNFRAAEIKPTLRQGKTKVVVTAVKPGGLADRLGLQEGDLFVAINGSPVQSKASLGATLNSVVKKAASANRASIRIVVDRPRSGRNAAAYALKSRPGFTGYQSVALDRVIVVVLEGTGAKPGIKVLRSQPTRSLPPMPSP